MPVDEVDVYVVKAHPVKRLSEHFSRGVLGREYIRWTGNDEPLRLNDKLVSGQAREEVPASRSDSPLP